MFCRNVEDYITISTNTTYLNMKGFERKLQVAYLVHLLDE